MLLVQQSHLGHQPIPGLPWFHPFLLKLTPSLLPVGRRSVIAVSHISNRTNSNLLVMNPLLPSVLWTLSYLSWAGQAHYKPYSQSEPQVSQIIYGLGFQSQHIGIWIYWRAYWILMRINKW